jgi:hypothetical protein
MPSKPLASSDAQLVTEACGRAAQELGLDRESTRLSRSQMD